MKAQAFLELVDKTLTAQQDYFAARRKQLGVITQQELLIKSKELEKQCRAVIKEGHLEPDELYTTVVHTTKEFQEQMRLTDEPGAYVTTVLNDSENRQLRLHLEDERDVEQT